jgi:pimeloyl-ACP methyl ester carboxylesterase
VDEQRYRESERALWSKFGLQPREKVVLLDRSATAVRVLEVGDGPPVVFVHGASNGATSWVSLAALLPQHRCILLDRPGCGLSPRREVPSQDMAQLDAFADDLVVDVLDSLSISRADLVGTSFGGYFALRAASAHPARVDQLVTLGWSFGAPVTKTPLVMRVAMQPTLRRLALRVPPSERIVRSLLRQIGLRGALESGRFGREEMQWYRSLIRDTDTMRNEIESAPRLATLSGFNDDTLLDSTVLAGIKTPTLLLWGSDDPMGDRDIARGFAARLPDATLEMMEGCGHAPWVDAPELVAARVGTFLHANRGPVDTPSSG